MPSNVVLLGFVLTVLGAGAVGLAAYALGHLRQHKRMRDEMREQTETTTRLRRASELVGRDDELNLFRELLGLASPRQELRGRNVSLLAVTGPLDSGKRALLEQYRQICADERQPSRCGPVIDLARARREDDLLSEIVRGLAEPDRFKVRFIPALDALRTARAGGESPASLGISWGTAAATSIGKLGVPGSGAAEPIAAQLRDRVTAPKTDVEALELTFRRDLRDLADADRARRVVLLFTDLDTCAPENDWVKERLLPELLQLPLLIVVAAQTDAGVRSLTAQAPAYALRLPRLPEENVRRYILDTVGVSDAAAVEELVALVDGLPARLQWVAEWYARHAAARDQAELPPELKATVSQRDIDPLLDQITSPFLRTLALAVSAMRWFNAPLLEETAALLRVPPEDDVVPTDLIGRSKPGWIERADIGWAIASTQSRLALMAELRRRDPDLYEDVSRLAARYHLKRLFAWERRHGRPDAVVGDDVFAYSVPTVEDERFTDSDYVADLAGWLYHLLALSPSRALDLLFARVAESLFAEEYDATLRLLGVDDDDQAQGLVPRQRLFLRLLRRVAVDLKEKKGADAVLERLYKAGPPTPLVRAMSAHLRAMEFYGAGRSAEAAEWFEHAHGHFIHCDEECAAAMRRHNATWLAFHLVAEDEVRALELVEDALRECEQVNDEGAVAELRRVKAVLLEQAQRHRDSEKLFALSIEEFLRLGRPDGLALARLGRGRVLRQLGRFDEAARELDDSLRTYEDLNSAPEARSDRIGVLSEILRVRFQRGDEVGAAQAEQEMLKLRDDAETRNWIGNAYFEVGNLDRAKNAYLRAVEQAPDVSVYHENLAGVLERLEDPEAVKFLTDAVERFDRNPELYRQLAAAIRRGERSQVDSAGHYADEASASPAVGEGGLTAVDALEKAIAVAPPADAPRYRTQLGEYLVEIGDLDRAWTVVADLRADDADFAADELAAEIEAVSEHPRIHSDADPPRHLVVEVADDLVPWVHPDNARFLYDDMFTEMRELVAARTGVLPPGVRVTAREDLPARTIIVRILGVPRYRFVLHGDVLAAASPEALEGIAQSLLPAVRPWDGGPAAWLELPDAAALTRAGIVWWDPRGVIVATVARAAELHAADLLQTETVAESLAQTGEALHARAPEVAAVMRQVLASGSAVPAPPVVLDALVAAGETKDVDAVVARLRVPATEPARRRHAHA